MALCDTITCTECGQTADVWYSPSDAKPKTCSACRKRRAEEKRQRDLDAVAALPLEERLRRIEAWIYDYEPQYVPPPRF